MITIKLNKTAAIKTRAPKTAFKVLVMYIESFRD